ncbi:hypothetical protein WA158_007583 [Blastocystis sp. Blastoise]
MGKYLLNGWTMLNENCPNNCNVPLFRNKENELVCPNCGPISAESTSETDKKEDSEGYKNEDDIMQIEEETSSQKRLFEEDIVSHFKSDDVTKLIGEKLLQGWTMLESSCIECHVPLMRDHEGTEICLKCNKIYNSKENINNQISIDDSKQEKIANKPSISSIKIDSSTDISILKSEIHKYLLQLEQENSLTKKTDILSYIKLCISSAAQLRDEDVTFRYEFLCTNGYTDIWNVSGIVGGKEVLLRNITSNFCSTVSKGSFIIDKTDDLNYKLCFHTKSSYNIDSYVIIYDKDDNLLIRKHALYNNDFCSFFTIRRPIDTVSSLAFKRGDVPDNWYKKTFDSSSWETVQNGQQTSSSNENQYYRISFEETQFDLMAAYNLHLQLNGDITIYMNDIQVYKTLSINPDNTEELNNMQIILNAYTLQKDNILAICISNPAGISQTNYMSIYMTLFFATEEGKCAQTIGDHTTECNGCTTCDELYDGSIRHSWKSSTDNSTNTLSILNNIYTDINRYILIPTEYIDTPPHTFFVKVRNTNDDAWNFIDSNENAVYPENMNIYDINGYTIPHQQFQFYAKLNNGHYDAQLREMFMMTCNRVPQPFIYQKYNYTFYLGDTKKNIIPVNKGYGAISIEPSLPRGLSMNLENGVIFGIGEEITTPKVYTITTQYPYLFTTSISIAISPCTSAAIKVVRYYSDYYSVNYQIFTIIHMETNEILMEELERTVQKEDTTLYYNYCVPIGHYNITLGNSDGNSWDKDSYLSIYLTNKPIDKWKNETNLDGYSLIFKERNELFASKNYILNLQYAISSQSEWKHNEGSIPSDWFSSTFDDSQWSTITVGKDTLSKAIHIYRKKPITTSSTANGHYDELIYRRFTIPFHYLQPGENVIAVMIIPHNDEPSTNYFDLSLRNVGTGDTRAYMSPYIYSDQINAFDTDYKTIYSFEPLKNDTIYYLNTLDEYSTINMYTVTSNYENTDYRPYDWILQGRINNHGNEPWIDIDTQTYVNWDTKFQRRVFGIPREKQGLYNEYRLTGLKGVNKELQIYQIEFYSNSLAVDYPSFEYSPNEVAVYVDTYIQEMIPTYSYYYTNFHVDPSFPEGLTINARTGSIRGTPREYTDVQQYTITATTYNNKKVSTTIKIQYKKCYGDQSVLDIEMRYNNIYRYTTVLLMNDTLKEGKPVFKETELTDVYREFRDPQESIDLIRHYYICIPHHLYTLTITPDKVETMTLPYGYSIRNAAKTVLNSGSFDEGHREASILLDTTMPVESGVTSWSYLASEENIGDWTSKYYDISSWKKMKENSIENNQKRNIYFRTSFTIMDITSHSSLDFRIKTIGSIYVYLNAHIIYHMTLNNSTLIEHTFTLNIQNNAIKSKNNILAIHIETKDILETEYLYVDCAYTYGAQTRLMNTFTYSSSSSFSPSHPLSNMFDIDFFTTTEFTGDSQIVFIDMGNEYKRYFNSIFLQTWNSSHPKTMDIYGREEEDYNWIPLLEKFEIPEKGLYSEYISVPMGLAGFRYIQIHFNKGMEKPASTIIAEFNFVYKSYTGSMCPSADGFISVGEDDSSYILCGENYQGYIYSICDGIIFDPPNYSFCTLLPPKSVRYPEISYIFFTDTIITPLLPTYERIVDSFNIQPVYYTEYNNKQIYIDLPSGLFLESETGKLYGKPTTILSTTTYTLQARNKIGTATFKFTIQINPGYCSMQSYPPTNIHENLILPCPDGYYGQIQIPCVAGDTQPVYSIAINECTSLTLTIGISLSVTLAIILIIIVIICIRMNKKNKEEIRRLKNPSEVMRTSNQSKAPVTQI